MRIRFHLVLMMIPLSMLAAASEPSLDAPPAGTRRIDTVNYRLGTQTFGIKYKFTDKTGLVETAERIHEMGSNILKFSMSKKVMGEAPFGLPKNDSIKSLTQMADKEPSVRAVLDMPFAYYLIWVYPFAHNDIAWADGLSQKERDEEYKEIHDLAVHLLKTYQGTGKSFYFGHWEGDWHLLQGAGRKREPTAEAIKGMIDWLNVRQEAIDDAKRETQAKDVYLYNYTEVNLVTKGMQGGKCLVNDVLPFTKVDYVSYSSYDTTGSRKANSDQWLRDALTYIDSKLPPKEGLQGKRVFIGEYGFPRAKFSPEQQDAFSRDVSRVALEWGCPFVLYWEIYCNEKPAGKHNGYWLIDDKNQKQPFYYTLQNYYDGMRGTVAEFKNKNGRPPTNDELQAEAIRILKQADSTRGKEVDGRRN